MIKKLLSLAALVAVCCSMSAQNLTLSKCPGKLETGHIAAKAPQKAFGKFNFTYTTANSLDDMSCIGVRAKSTYDACIFVPGSYKGKKITNISFWLYGVSVLTDVSAWISTDVDNMAASTTADGGSWAVATPLEGQNIVTVDKDFTVPATGCYVGYSLTTTSVSNQAGQYPILISGSEDIDGGMIMRFTGGDDYSFANFYGAGYGNLTVGVTLEGDFPDNMLSIDPTFHDVFTAIGGKGTARAKVMNMSLNPINSVAYTVTDAAGNVTDEKVSDLGNASIAAGMANYVEFEMDAAETVGVDKRTITVTKVNGNDVASTENITSKGSVYTKKVIYPRTALIEKFTGQDCGNCPGGEQVILESISGVKDASRVARIDHHAGYYDDIFTITESKSVASYFGINYAPCCMLDRTFQAERLSLPADYTGVIWHPGYMTANMLQNEIDKPSYITVNLNAYLDKEAKKVVVNVKGVGEEYKDSVVNLTVVLCQSGYAARQAGATNWKHNDFPLDFLNPTYKGDVITFDADGNYEQNYTYDLKDKYNTVAVDFNQLSVVAFASKFKSKTNAEVYNAASIELRELDPAGIDNVDSNLGIATIIGRYTVDGQKVSAPVKGINILKTSDGRTLKVLVK